MAILSRLRGYSLSLEWNGHWDSARMQSALDLPALFNQRRMIRWEIEPLKRVRAFMPNASSAKDLATCVRPRSCGDNLPG